MEQKTCNQCLLQSMEEARQPVLNMTNSEGAHFMKGTGFFYCSNHECPNFALLQIPIEDLPPATKD